MKKLPAALKPGDSIEIIAPASRCSRQELETLQALFSSWQLHCLIAQDIFGDDLLCANSDEIRFKHLHNALHNPETKAVICARGGYGSLRLIPELAKITPPSSAKLFVGMSDITALQLFFQQYWQWPTIHGASTPERFSPESIASLKAILFGEVTQVEFSQLSPLNAAAEKNHNIEATIIGGNLCLVQASIGTTWQMHAQNKIILLEDTGERGYRIDRMLEHLRQASLFKNAAAILFGDFIGGEEQNGSTLIPPVLSRFAQTCNIPVLQIKGIGHGYSNFPIPLGTPAKLQLGKETKLNVAAGIVV